VIDHPEDNSKYLVHGCLEGPEAGVYYRGKGEITNGVSTLIELPEYVKYIATNLTLQVTGIYSGDSIKKYNSTEIIDNKFSVYGPNGTFFWIVYGTRMVFDVEPSKATSIVKGDGPYKWI
jgi:hypothetical protein